MGRCFAPFARHFQGNVGLLSVKIKSQAELEMPGTDAGQKIDYRLLMPPSMTSSLPTV